MAKIVACDNEKDIRDLIVHVLEEKGHKVTAVKDGSDCLKAMQGEKPDLVLVDIMMPDLSGWDVFNKIMKKNKKQKVAFISVLEISEARKKELSKKGLVAYIRKPFSADEFLEKVNEILKA